MFRRLLLIALLLFAPATLASGCPQGVLKEIVAKVLSTNPVLDPAAKSDYVRVFRVTRSLLALQDADLEVGLSELSGLPPATLAAIVKAAAEMEPAMRVALFQRLRWLGEFGLPAQRQAFFKNLTRTRESYDGGPAPKLSETPDLQHWVDGARSRFVGDSEHVVRHLIGEAVPSTSAEGPQSRTGRHLFDSWDRFLFDRSDRILANHRDAFNALIDGVEGQGVSDTTIAGLYDTYNEIGFDMSRRGWSRFLLKEMQLISFKKLPNGTLCLTFPREVFTDQAWRGTYASAKYGSSPPGGKTVFPTDWSLTDQVKPAIESVLANPEARVLRRGVKNGQPSFYLKAPYQGVWVEVGITGQQVGTAFPSWRQYQPPTIGQAYIEWWSAWERVRDVGYKINTYALVPSDLKTVRQLISGFYGVLPVGLPVSEWRTLSQWLDPALLSQSPDPVVSKNFHQLMFEFLERERVLRELEHGPAQVFP